MGDGWIDGAGGCDLLPENNRSFLGIYWSSLVRESLWNDIWDGNERGRMNKKDESRDSRRKDEISNAAHAQSIISYNL